MTGPTVFATIGPLHNWDTSILVGVIAAIVVAFLLHYLGPRPR